jgi:hypothetical protein
MLSGQDPLAGYGLADLQDKAEIGGYLVIDSSPI